MPVMMTTHDGLYCSTQLIYIINIVLDSIDVSLALIDHSNLKLIRFAGAKPRYVGGTGFCFTNYHGRANDA